MASPPSDRLTWVIGELDLEPAHQVVEIGCGHGVAATLALDRLGSVGRYLGIDRSTSMVAAATKRNAGAVADGRCRFELADLLGASVAAASQDRVFACRVAAMARPGALATALGWLAPGGVVAVAFDDPDPRRTTALVAGVERSALTVGCSVEVRRLDLEAGEVVLVLLAP